MIQLHGLAILPAILTFEMVKVELKFEFPGLSKALKHVLGTCDKS